MPLAVFILAILFSIPFAAQALSPRYAGSKQDGRGLYPASRAARLRPRAVDGVVESSTATTTASLADLNLPTTNFTYMALWNGTGPQMTDVLQDTVDNCWLVAASLALVQLSPTWVASHFQWPNGTSISGAVIPWSSTAYTTIYSPNDGSAHRFLTEQQYESATEDHPGGVWWNSALTQAVFLLAAQEQVYGVFPNGTYMPNTGAAAIALELYTGLPAAVNSIPGYASIDDFYTDLSKGTYTPVVLTTYLKVNATTPRLWGEHDYPVFGVGEAQGGGRTVTLRNPWGQTEVHPIENLWENCCCVNHLQGWVGLEGLKSVV